MEGREGRGDEGGWETEGGKGKGVNEGTENGLRGEEMWDMGRVVPRSGWVRPARPNLHTQAHHIKQTQHSTERQSLHALSL